MKKNGNSITYDNYVNYVETIKSLKKNEKYEEAIILLHQILDVIEKHSQKTGEGVAPWYYDQLTIIYKKMKQLELANEVLIRFSKQNHAIGARTEKLLERANKINRT